MNTIDSGVYIAIPLDAEEKLHFEEAASRISLRCRTASEAEDLVADQIRELKEKAAKPFLNQKKSLEREITGLKIAYAKAEKTKNEELKKKLMEEIKTKESSLQGLNEAIKTAGDNDPNILGLKKEIGLYEERIIQCESSLSSMDPKAEKLVRDEMAAKDKLNQQTKGDDLTTTRSAQAVGGASGLFDAASNAVFQAQQALAH